MPGERQYMKDRDKSASIRGRVDCGTDTLTDKVYRDLSAMLMSGQVCPGDRLSLRTLAEQLGTSNMPVREALRQLSAAGAVEISPQRAARIPLMTLSRFRELLVIRLLLEGLAAEQAAQRVSERGINRARRFAESFEAEIRKLKPNRSVLVQRNMQFHFSVYEAAGTPVLFSLIERLWLLVGPVINYDLRQPSERLSKRPALRHHKMLIDSLVRHDSVGARAALTGDLSSAAELIIASGQLVDDDPIVEPLVTHGRSNRGTR
jgi:DNA-binding GntR family transcriptional regulator